MTPDEARDRLYEVALQADGEARQKALAIELERNEIAKNWHDRDDARLRELHQQHEGSWARGVAVQSAAWLVAHTTGDERDVMDLAQQWAHYIESGETPA